jgi:hypothetical protein
MVAPTRGPVVYFEGALTAAQTWWAAAGLAANPGYTLHEQRRLVGSVNSSVAPGTVEIQLSPDGTNWDITIPLTADPDNANAYPFDIDLFLPWVRFVVIDAGAGSTVRLAAWAFEQGTGANFFSASGSGGGTVYTKDAPLTPLGYAQYSLVASSVTLATAAGGTIPAGATYVLIQLGVGGTGVTARFRDDGTAPTTTVGFPLLQGVQFLYESNPLSALQLIGTAAGPTELNLSFYK